MTSTILQNIRNNLFYHRVSFNLKLAHASKFGNERIEHVKQTSLQRPPWGKGSVAIVDVRQVAIVERLK